MILIQVCFKMYHFLVAAKTKKNTLQFFSERDAAMGGVGETF